MTNSKSINSRFQSNLQARLDALRASFSVAERAADNIHAPNHMVSLNASCQLEVDGAHNSIYFLFADVRMRRVICGDCPESYTKALHGALNDCGYEMVEWEVTDSGHPVLFVTSNL